MSGSWERKLRQKAALATPPRPIPEWWSETAVQEVRDARRWLDDRSPEIARRLADALDRVEELQREANEYAEELERRLQQRTQVAYRAMGGKEEGDSWVAISGVLFDLDALKEQA